MFSCQIDEKGFCFHTTQSLLKGENIILSEEDKIGWTWDGEKWVEPDPVVIEETEPVEEEVEEMQNDSTEV